MHRTYPANPFAITNGIRFGNCLFSAPARLGGQPMPEPASLFAVLMPDFTWAPYPFQPLFFGERMSPAELLTCARAAAGKELYVANCSMALATPAQRQDVLRDLVRAYDPLCNRDRNGGGEQLEQRIAALEKKNQEHEALLKVILAATARLFEPSPEPRRRTVGFAPAVS